MFQGNVQNLAKQVFAATTHVNFLKIVLLALERAKR